ncbi:Maf family protein [Luminiphilus syltensis]|uniref:Maf family protein n=1 Tax=Luminiphilus syltensis TaxID=1341119 RepID=UPI00058D5979|nr:nucleoside triphosphate pyrophosphatase [Luminiphilus syltensis]
MSTSQPPSLTLASTSRWRAALLRRLRLDFAIQSPQVDECLDPSSTPAENAERLATEKARSIDVTGGLVIGSDQVAWCDGRYLGKPGTAEKAVDQLRYCAGKTMDFHTGLCLWIPGKNECVTRVVPYRVHLRELSTAEIKAYIAADSPLDCAGSFRWESLGIALFRRLEGDDPTALEGLPLITLCQLLRGQGLSIPPRAQPLQHGA